MVRYGMIPVVSNTITAAYRMRLLLHWLAGWLAASPPPLTRIMLVGEKENGKGKGKKKKKKFSTYGTCTPCGPLPYQYHRVRYSSTSHTLSCTVNNPTNQRNSTSARNPFDNNHSSPPVPTPPPIFGSQVLARCLLLVCLLCVSDFWEPF